MYRQKNSLYYQQPTTELTHSNGITKKKKPKLLLFYSFLFLFTNPISLFLLHFFVLQNKTQNTKTETFFSFSFFLSLFIHGTCSAPSKPGNSEAVGVRGEAVPPEWDFVTHCLTGFIFLHTFKVRIVLDLVRFHA